VKNSNQGKQKTYRYDYSELEIFLDEEIMEKEILQKYFLKFCTAYMKMATFIIHNAPIADIGGQLVIDKEDTDFTEQFMEIFRILGRLSEVKEGGES